MCVSEKRVFCLLLCLCICLCAGCGAPEQAAQAMLLDEGATGGVTSYVTEEAEYGTLYVERECSTSVGYWKEVHVNCADMAGAALEELRVTKNQEVKAGDVLAVFDVPYSQAELNALYAEREIAWLRYQSGLSSYTLSLQQAQSTLADRTAGTADYAVAQQEVIRAQSAYDYYVTGQMLSISGIDERIADLEEKLENNVITAPMDGKVISVTGALKKGDVVGAATELCTIVDPEDTFFYVQYSEVFPFYSGAEVVVYSRYYEEGKEFPARVHASPADTGEKKGYVILSAVDPAVQQGIVDAGGVGFAMLRAELQQVLAVPDAAVQREDGDCFLMVLQDGHPVKRYVIVGDVLSRLKDGVAAVQVLDGLQPGELVITG